MARFCRQSTRVLAHLGDDWHPCYPGGRVAVHLFVGFDGPLGLTAAVSVWGADDTGVERETTLDDALDLYVRLTRNTCPPRASLLTRWGFRPA